ncbi:hypothetical protein AXE65_06070 [Ventosimonas gracilis]|uniref:Lipoprotein n=1 Tax=Ventosimonas gracilis TaxID=1680762 RepID=A0A139SMP5_9GAMM|nr:hypothetical protein [Ventosimonas gracilis]KXU35740.1 hypothetical protein AXE65_06070 [Ventosimonas gracilis]
MKQSFFFYWLCLALLSGCQSTADNGVDPRLSGSHSAQFFSKSGLQACGAGALAGALACQLGNPGDKTRCMLAAAAVGCGVGMGANYYLDHQRAQYANTEERLDAAIADVRKDNQQLQSLTATARQVINDDRQKIKKIKEDIAKNQVQREQAQQQLAQIDANTAYLKKTLAEVKSREQEWQKIAAAEQQTSGTRIDLLNAEISRMQQQRSQLESEIDQLYTQRSAIQLG